MKNHSCAIPSANAKPGNDSETTHCRGVRANAGTPRASKPPQNAVWSLRYSPGNKGLEGQPVNIFRMGAAILIRDAEQVSSHVTQREVPADVGRRQLLGERGAIESREHPLR